jgi:hypothetical protein
MSVGFILQTPLQHQAFFPLAGSSPTSTQPAKVHNRKESVTSAMLIPDSCDDKMKTSGFNAIYRDGRWGPRLGTVEAFYNDAKWPPQERRSASGGGSDRGYATETSLRVLNEAIVAFNVSTMIDLPCGDVNWIFDSWPTDSLASIWVLMLS